MPGRYLSAANYPKQVLQQDDQESIPEPVLVVGPFVRNTVGTDGTAGRNILDAPGYRDVDLGIFRNFKFKERYTLEFPAGSTNAFNLVSLGSPGETLSSSNFGVITGAEGMWKIQLA